MDVLTLVLKVHVCPAEENKTVDFLITAAFLLQAV